MVLTVVRMAKKKGGGGGGVIIDRGYLNIRPRRWGLIETGLIREWAY